MRISARTAETRPEWVTMSGCGLTPTAEHTSIYERWGVPLFRHARPVDTDPVPKSPAYSRRNTDSKQDNRPANNGDRARYLAEQHKCEQRTRDWFAQ
jgi:hypothetical protein